MTKTVAYVILRAFSLSIFQFPWNLPQPVAVLLMAALPLAELRLAIPVAIHSYGFPWAGALALAVAGNMLPVPFILLLLDPVAKIATRAPLFDRLLQWVLSRSRKRSAEVQKYETIGLMLFVAVPLPLTGAWTGAIIAYILGLKFWFALISIGLGVLIAGVIVTSLSLLGWIGAAIAGVGLSVLAVTGVWKISK